MIVYAHTFCQEFTATDPLLTILGLRVTIIQRRRDMAKFSVGQYLAYNGDAQTYGVIQIIAVDEGNQEEKFRRLLE